MEEEGREEGGYWMKAVQRRGKWRRDESSLIEEASRNSDDGEECSYDRDGTATVVKL